MTFDHDLKATVRTIPDYPKKGILFRDITPLLADARAFRRAVDELVQPWAGLKIDKVAGIEARGFILGGGSGAFGSLTRSSFTYRPPPAMPRRASPFEP